eukprot:185551-Chlamydomonas_euryale.AAC.1
MVCAIGRRMHVWGAWCQVGGQVGRAAQPSTFAVRPLRPGRERQISDDAKRCVRACADQLDMWLPSQLNTT